MIEYISHYSNSQNAVKQSDLSSNKPYHVELEKLALSTYCPDGTSRWFYERAGGSYKVMLEREGKTAAGIKRLQDSMPPARKIVKTDLAKFICAWNQRPDLVSLGGQKNFSAFMDLMSQDSEQILDTKSYKDIISKAIIFKAAYKLIRPKFIAFQANITAYTVAVLSKNLAHQLSLSMIWQNQSISNKLGQQIVVWSEEVSKILNESAKGRMLSEWAKKKDCWDTVAAYEFSEVMQDIPECK